MTIPASVVPAVKAYLLAGLTARPALAIPVQVSYGQPAGLENDNVIIGDVKGQFSPFAMVGGGGAEWLDETYEQSIEVLCLFGDNDIQAADAQAHALAADVCDFIRADPTCGGLVLEARPTNYVSAEDVTTNAEDVPIGRHVRYFLSVQITTTS